MLKYLVGIFSILLIFVVVKLTSRSVKSTCINEQVLKALAQKIRASLSVTIPVLACVCFALLNFNFLRGFLYSVLSETMVSAIVSILKVVFGTQSVFYSLQLLGVYAFLSSSILCIAGFAVQFLVARIYVLGAIVSLGSSVTQFSVRKCQNKVLSHSFLSLGQIRI